MGGGKFMLFVCYTRAQTPFFIIAVADAVLFEIHQIVRSFFFSLFHFRQEEHLTRQTDKHFSAVAKK